ncbi:MAG: hypothetical protein QM726_10400 [Chitinophagaceae bacterium]
MLQLISKPASSLMLAFSILLFSFTTTGSHSFEVYLNKKLLFQQYVSKDMKINSIPLNQAKATDEIEVYYNHCGVSGTGRIITIRDEQNKILKEYKFPDSPNTKTLMSCDVKDITSLQSLNKRSTLYLYYASNEMPEARMLASFASGQ